MVLGQSAATAACQAMDAKVGVQQVDHAGLHARLLADQQVLTWSAPRSPRPETIHPAQLPGIVLDDESLVKNGEWLPSTSVSPFVGQSYWHDGHEGKKTARFATKLKAAGLYEVRFSYTANSNRATNVAVTVSHAAGESTVKVNEQLIPPIDRIFVSLGRFRFDSGREAAVSITNSGADGYVVVDAIQFVPVKDGTKS